MSAKPLASFRTMFFDEFVRHLRNSVRGLCRTPGFTAVVLITLALGIGANSVIFSVVYPLLLKPLPYPDADRLVVVAFDNGRPQIGNPGCNIAAATA